MSGWSASLNDPGSMHRQGEWLERAHDTDLPLWLRVAAMAYGCHQRNGHATFKAGWLAGVLGKSADQVSRAIRTAKAKGWIDPSSTQRCLVVRSDAIDGGIGHPHDQCPVHDGKLTKRQKLTLSVKE